MGSNVFRFELARDRDTWLVSLPPTKEPYLNRVALSEVESASLLPSIEKYLSRIWWFGVWPVRYRVKFVERAAPTHHSSGAPSVPVEINR